MLLVEKLAFYVCKCERRDLFTILDNLLIYFGANLHELHLSFLLAIRILTIKEPYRSVEASCWALVLVTSEQVAIY